MEIHYEKIRNRIPDHYCHSGGRICRIFLIEPFPTFRQTLPLTIGGPALETSGLIYIAEDQHYFDENRLNVTEQMYDSGAQQLVSC